MGKRVSGMFQGGKGSGSVETVRVDPLKSLVLLGVSRGRSGLNTFCVVYGHELLFCFSRSRFAHLRGCQQPKHLFNVWGSMMCDLATISCCCCHYCQSCFAIWSSIHFEHYQGSSLSLSFHVKSLFLDLRCGWSTIGAIPRVCIICHCWSVLYPCLHSFC